MAAKSSTAPAVLVSGLEQRYTFGDRADGMSRWRAGGVPRLAASPEKIFGLAT
jgi:hypothetical protein